MREIKFRGKRVDNKKLEYGHLVKSVNDRYYIVVYATEDAINVMYDLAFKFVEVIPETVGQFTGLTDKNGKEIYESDIVKSTHIHNKQESIGKVYFEDFTWFGATDYLDYLSKFCSIEVVGNIHEKGENK